MYTASKNLQNYYLSWLNDFLTVERFAEYYELNIVEAGLLIDLGRISHEKMVQVFKDGLL